MTFTPIAFIHQLISSSAVLTDNPAIDYKLIGYVSLISVTAVEVYANYRQLQVFKLTNAPTALKHHH
ncbi:hypothetical protein IAR50_006326 [Cryptococcus sp. DSM 104548]